MNWLRGGGTDRGRVGLMFVVFFALAAIPVLALFGSFIGSVPSAAAYSGGMDHLKTMYPVYGVGIILMIVGVLACVGVFIFWGGGSSSRAPPVRRGGGGGGGLPPF